MHTLSLMRPLAAAVATVRRLAGAVPRVAVVFLLVASMPGASAGEAVGEVVRVVGSAERRAVDGTRVTLMAGTPIHEQDQLTTGERSLLSVRFSDDTRFLLGARARFRIDSVRDGADAGFSAEVLQGAFRFVTGLIAKRRAGAMRVRTGVVATIGIRGTTVGGEVEDDSATIVLLADEQASGGTAIEVGNAYGSVVIDQAGYGTRVPDAVSPPSPPVRMTLRSIDNLVRNLNSIQRNAGPRSLGR